MASFLALGLLWREPRLDPARAGRALPGGLTRVLDSTPLRVALRLLGVVAFAYVAMAAVLGRDDALNPTAGVVYVLLWVGLVALSLREGQNGPELFFRAFNAASEPARRLAEEGFAVMPHFPARGIAGRAQPFAFSRSCMDHDSMILNLNSSRVLGLAFGADAD